MNRISIVIPCCNEEDALAVLPERLFPVVRRLQEEHAVQIIFVDDGSTDATPRIIGELHERHPALNIATARHPRNLGLGAALRTGTHIATGQTIVTLDADGTYPFEIIEPLIHAVEAGADVATASPYHRHGGVAGVSWFRILISKGASLLYRVLVDWKIATYTAMVRAYRADVVIQTDTAVPGFLYVAQLLVEARRRGAAIVEVPAVLHQREVGASKARIVQITLSHLRYMRHLLKLRLTGQFWLPAHETGATVDQEVGERVLVKQ